MVEELRVTDGSVACNLAAQPNSVLEYVPQAPDAEAGGTRQAAGYEYHEDHEYPGVAQIWSGNVLESLRATLGGETLAEALVQRGRLERLLRQAERVQAGSGEARVYVECRRQTGLPLFRSELLAGALAELDFEGYWPERGQLRIAVHWQRRPWWEGAEVEIPLLGPAGDEQLGGMTVVCAAGPRGWAGYVDLAPIEGEVATPLILQFTNLAAAYPVCRLYAALLVSPDPIELVHFFEGEGARTGGISQPPAADGSYSGGRYRLLLWNDTAETCLLDWIINSAQLAAAGGRWYRLLARWCPAPAYDDLLVQARLTLDGATKLWVGPWVHPAAAHELCELTSLPLPPLAGPSSGLRDLRLELWARRSTAGAHSLNLDYLAFLALDGLRRYDTLAAGGPGIDRDCYLLDDPLGYPGAAGQLRSHSALGDVGDWLVAGEPLCLRPGCQHRLSLLWESAGGQARADRPASVRLWYRPRVTLP